MLLIIIIIIIIFIISSSIFDFLTSQFGWEIFTFPGM